jgi:hypothetical protein
MKTEELKKELLSVNELLLLESLIERLNNEIKLEGRTMSDITLAINELHYQRDRHDKERISNETRLYRR